jgi:diaminopimelate decarboxylase
MSPDGSAVVSRPLDAPIELGLLPFTARIGTDGRLRIGGCDVEELADEFGTPLFVYDERHLRARCRDYARYFGGPANVAYASKAFLCLAMARLVGDERINLDVATGGELHVAVHAGFPAERMVLHGNNKSFAELKRALEVGVGRVVVDSLDELVRLDGLGQRGLGPVDVLIRVNPGIDADTHAHLATASDDSKFGFPIRTGAAMEAATWAEQSTAVNLVGLHMHLGSQLAGPGHTDQMRQACEVVAAFAAEVQAGTGAPMREICLGGGLGVRYVSDDEAPGLNAFSAELTAAFESAFSALEFDPLPRLTVEPGRSIAATAGVTLYRVGTIKEAVTRTYVAVDGGMSDNVRPTAYGARYEAFIPARANARRPLTVAVAGKHCEQGDVLVESAQMPDDLAVGDVLCTPVTGAYGMAMASNYNKVPRPAVVFAMNGKARLVVRRETLDDLVRHDEV